MTPKEKSLTLLYLFIDLCLLNVSLVVASFLHFQTFSNAENSEYYWLMNISWIFAYFLYQKKNLFLRDGFPNRVKRQFYRFGVYFSIASLIIVAFKFEDLSREVFFGTNLLFFILKFITFYFLYRFLAYRRRKGRNVLRALIVGYNSTAEELYEYMMQNPDLGYKVVGFLEDKNYPFQHKLKLGSLEDFQKVYKETAFHEVIIALPLNKEKEIGQIIELAEFNGNRCHLIPDYYQLIKRNAEIRTIGGIPLVNTREIPLDNLAYRILKRAFDILFSSVMILLLSPVYLAIAVSIKLDSKGPVFYNPVRIGKGGAKFKVYKFRSMKDCDNSVKGTKSTVLGDPRITKVGAFLRKSNLDELPQFFNVLKGEMSVVGPRPHRAALNTELQRKMDQYMIRSYVKPGVTGWAQVNGWRGPTETRLQYTGRTLHDIWYIENWAFALDIYIIFLTVFGKKVRMNAF